MLGETAPPLEFDPGYDDADGAPESRRQDIRWRIIDWLAALTPLCEELVGEP